MAISLKSIPHLSQIIQNFAIPELLKHFNFKNNVRYVSLAVVYPQNFESRI